MDTAQNLTFLVSLLTLVVTLAMFGVLLTLLFVTLANAREKTPAHDDGRTMFGTGMLPSHIPPVIDTDDEDFAPRPARPTLHI